ncbi:MAG: hypothetical protein GY715_17285 [Planctomycetes bacterium]|nr:hypothetical protein [Planctomycetota bacterium]
MTIIVCPTEFERRRLVRALPRGADVRCCGVGGAAIDAWVQQIDATERAVILAGLAGALAPRLAAGEARWITAVRATDGETWTPTLGADASPCVATTVECIVVEASGKRDLHLETGADVVDLESVAFATAAVARGWRWGIVRGVSDDAATGLPPEIDRWVDARGRARPMLVATSLLRSPGLLPAVRGLHRAGLRAMASVADLVTSGLEKDDAADRGSPGSAAS